MYIHRFSSRFLSFFEFLGDLGGEPNPEEVEQVFSSLPTTDDPEDVTASADALAQAFASGTTAVAAAKAAAEVFVTGNQARSSATAEVSFEIYKTKQKNHYPLRVSPVYCYHEICFSGVQA